jgi:hypothetical protein
MWLATYQVNGGKFAAIGLGCLRCDDNCLLSSGQEIVLSPTPYIFLNEGIRYTPVRIRRRITWRDENHQRGHQSAPSLSD